jgi:hypothetical protein
MGKIKETLAQKQERLSINKAASNFLCDQPSGDLYGAYKELKQVQEDGNGSAIADNYVVVWQPLNHMTVDQIVEIIESSASGSDEPEVPEFIEKINWELLRKQKLLLLETINNDAIDPEHKEGLEGILNTLDALQDYAVDDLGKDEIDVFGINPE